MFSLTLLMAFLFHSFFTGKKQVFSISKTCF
ncbi:hypothetical protein M121_0525, partial [Bacteroides fragilis str. 3783N2-1]